MTIDSILGTALDELLAPLDAIARIPRPTTPTPAELERAYALCLIAAELTTHGASPWLVDVALACGVEPEDALTIGRAFVRAMVRVAQAMDT